MKVTCSTTPLGRGRVGLKKSEGVLRTSTGMLYLISILLKQAKLQLERVRGVEVKLEETNRPFDDPDFEIAAKRLANTDVFCVTAYEFNLQEVRALRDKLKEENPDILFFVGGPVATHLPEYVMEVTGADAVFRGEADLTFRRVIEHLAKGGKLKEVDEFGVIVRDGDEIITTARSSVIPTPTLDEYRAIDLDLDLLQDLVKEAGYLKVDLSFSRGCPYAVDDPCTFCQVSPVGGHKRLPEDRVIEILRRTSRIPNLAHVVFGDGTFGGGKAGARSLLRRIDREGISFSRGFFGELSVDMLLGAGSLGDRTPDGEMLDLMKGVGFLAGELGIESLSDPQLAKFNKARHTFEEVSRLLIELRRRKMYLGGGIHLMSFDTTAVDATQCIKNAFVLAQRLLRPPITVSTSITPYVGTAEYKKLMDLKDADPTRFFLSVRGMDAMGLVENTGDPTNPYIIKDAIPVSDSVLLRSTIDYFAMSALGADPFALNSPSGVYGSVSGVTAEEMVILLLLMRRHAARDHDSGLVRSIDGAIDEAERTPALGSVLPAVQSSFGLISSVLPNH